MCKKIVMAATGLCLVLGLFFGRDAASYVGTSVGWVKTAVKDNVPPRARMVGTPAQPIRDWTRERMAVRRLAKGSAAETDTETGDA